MPEGENFENTLLEYHTFDTDAPVWAFFSANLPPFWLFLRYFSMILRGMQKSLQNPLTEALLHDNMNT
ncbi:hypothetical protein [Faecalibacterium prausnitzii]|uniref:hypothetical protein n=1 Tax=Faecalibacterium prausnitzii TaxID=853 RepID=UPI001A9A44E4|nr:hypothetical protein [Faecalibacterium prausnitzii]